MVRHRAGAVVERLFAPSKGFLTILCIALAAVLVLVIVAIVDDVRASQTPVQAETMELSGSHVSVRDNADASGGKEVAFFTNGSASSGFDGAAAEITLRARGTACQGNPRLMVYVDGDLKGSMPLTSGAFSDHTLVLSDLSAGAHTLRVSFRDDFYAANNCDRNAYLDSYTLTLPSTTPPPGGADSGGADPVLVGAGDIARCSSPGAEATAKLLDGIPGTVYTTGDNAYESGTASEFANCYDPTWGRHKARTKPSPGNHEYYTPRASGYFGYFGAAAGDPSKGYYSYDLGEWHVVSLNSMCEDVGGCGATSPMVTWLKKDLAANPKSCTLAYFHHPLFSSGEHGNNAKMRPTWDALYAARADVVLNGHDHDYERFAPQSPGGEADAARGIREFVVGTGGGSHYGIANVQPNSEAHNTDTYGVLKLTLHPDGYDWQFVPQAGETFTDSGTAGCH